MLETTSWLLTLIRAAGIGLLLLSAGSVVIPRLLDWTKHIESLPPLLSRLFWVYAGYVLVTNACMGLVSVMAPQWLAEDSPLAIAVNAYIALYWGARLLIQIFCFKRDIKPTGAGFRLAETALTALFCFLTFVFSFATIVGLATVTR